MKLSRAWALLAGLAPSSRRTRDDPAVIPETQTPQEPVPAGWKGLPDWKSILDTNRPLWDSAVRAASSGPRTLIPTTVGGSPAVGPVESLLAVALTLRGASVQAMLCDSSLPACLRADRSDIPTGILARYELPAVLCGGCFRTGSYVFDPLGLPVQRVGDLLSEHAASEALTIGADTHLNDIPSLTVDSIPVGEHAHAGALRYFARGDIAHEELGEVVLRRYLEAAIRTMRVTQALLAQDGGFASACFNHGIYTPHGIIGEVCRASGVRVVNWSVAYRRQCFIFSHGDTYHHTLMDEPCTAWEGMPWTDEMERDIMEYLKSRATGSRDWVWFHEAPDDDFRAFAQQVGLNLEAPIVGLLTNVIWDAQLHYPANAFPDMLTWLFETIAYFKRRPDLQLLIRIHPAEIRGTVPSQQRVAGEIATAFPDLPANVFIIPPESPVSTYAAMDACSTALIYGTKTGVELTSVGLPVVVAGEAWIRNKGLTLDARDRSEYFELLDRLPLQRTTDAAQLQRARKYAYHFFFRRMVPLSFMGVGEGRALFAPSIATLDDLLPGRDIGLDLICDGILRGTPFVYPAERAGPSSG